MYRREKLIEQYRQLHKKKRGYGRTGENKADRINKLIEGHDFQSVLDYGCGKSQLAFKLNIPKAYRFDPAIEEISRPSIIDVDLVVCTDVLEHIPEELLNEFLTDVMDYSSNCFFTISLRTAGNILPNGENCHPTVKKEEWWIELLEKYFGYVEVTYRANDGTGIHVKTFK